MQVQIALTIVNISKLNALFFDLFERYIKDRILEIFGLKLK